MKRILLWVTLLGVTTISAVAGPIATPLQWTGVGANNHWYQLVQQTSTWDDAVAGAAGMGGYLATVASADENFFIFAVANDPSVWVGDQSGNLHGPRLGGSDVTLNGNWQWVNGETWSYTNWYVGEPNFVGTEDSLAFFDASRPVSASQTWNNVSKSSLLAGYVVEWDGDSRQGSETPEPASLVLVASAVGVIAWRRRRIA